MPGAIPFHISPAVLEWARTSMGYSIGEAARKIGIDDDRYEAWETGKKQPTYKQLEALAEKVFKRSIAILFLPEPPLEDHIQRDFRNLSNAEVIKLSSEVRLSLKRAKKYQLILNEVKEDAVGGKYKNFSISLNDNPIISAAKFRNFIELSLEEQKRWAYDSAFNFFKSKVEELGIYIFQMKMPLEEARAFCLSDQIPLIVLSTEDSRNGKVFSLFHEVCHILFNLNGIFRDSMSGKLNKEYRDVEAFCNRFAAAFLVPEEDFDQELQHDKDIFRLSRLYNVSNEVIARKLLYRKLISEDEFWRLKKGWDSQAKEAKEKEKEKMREREVSGIAQATRILYEKGKPYVSSVIEAYQNGRISSSDCSNYLETKLDQIPKILERLGN